MSFERELTIAADEGGLSQAVAISTTSAQSTAFTAASANPGTNEVYLVVFATVECFFRQGADPTALDTGVDQFLPANTWARLNVPVGNKLAFKTAVGSGTVYITPRV